METLRIAATALRAHKLRSFLTLLGVIIGVMSVVTVVSIISGLNAYIAEKVFKLNPDVYIVSRFGLITSREQFLEAIKRKPISWTDFELVRDRCGSCAAVGAAQRRRDAVKRGPERLNDIRVHGTTANMSEINNLDVEAGRFFTEGEERRSALTVVIGADVREQLFGRLDPIGRTIRVANQPMRVIGLLRKQGTVFGESQDDIVYIPVTTWRKMFGSRQSIDIFVRARGGVEGMDASMDEVRVMIRTQRRTAFRSDDPFGYRTAEAMQMLWKGITAGLFSMMVIISGISLVVGGIVIMNIMLVSVVERTREIGVRRALGATRQAIRRQFLTEAVLLSLGGGISGVLVGAAIAKLISALSPMPTAVRPMTVIAGLLVSVVTGVVAGFVPAVRASRLPPIDALRWE
jgi:putative ABC transport system permease protein